MKAEQVQELTDAELENAIEDSRRELFDLKMQNKTGQLENTAQIRLKKKDIARLLTEQSARAKREPQTTG